MEADKPHETDTGIAINISPPEVVRLDSRSGDEEGQDQYESVSEPVSIDFSHA